MIDYSQAELGGLFIHKIGNAHHDETLELSDTPVDVSHEDLNSLLIPFFLSSFQSPEYFSFFNKEEGAETSMLFNAASETFESETNFQKTAENIARRLFLISEQSDVKSGELFVAYFKDIVLDDELADAIGIFKSEHKQPFIKVHSQSHAFSISLENGINLTRPEKACLIVNLEKNAGYKICLLGASGRSFDAQFWREDFLNVVPYTDEYLHTRQAIAMTQKFVTKKLPKQADVSKLEQMELMNRTEEYFKTKETFDKDDFETEVLQDTQVINAYRKYKDDFKGETDIMDQFEISPLAVKKQSKVFKSILKLDKNFHIYIHGNRDLIERGVDEDGKKFYKVYYEQEQ